MGRDIVSDMLLSIENNISKDDIEIVRSKLAAIACDYHFEFVGTALSTEIDVFPFFYKAYFLDLKMRGCSNCTISFYHGILSDFFMYNSKPIEQLTHNDILAYLYKYQSKHGISNRTLDRRRSCLNSFFEWAKNEEYIPRNPCRTLKAIKYLAKDREPLTRYELDSLRDACKDLRERAILEFLYSTGCRVSEAVSINIKDVDMQKREIPVIGKGNKYGKVYLTVYALNYLNKYLKSRTDDNEALFVTNIAPCRRISTDTIQRILAELGTRAGIERKIHPHLFRHTLATDCLRAGMSIDKVSKLLRHSNISTTQIYAKTDMLDVQREHDKYIL